MTFDTSCGVRMARLMFDADIARSQRRMIPLISKPLCSRCVVSHVTRHTSYITRHTSHITHHTPHAYCFPTPHQGYNAVCTLNRKCSGSITTDDLDFVVARWFMLMAETMISAGIPQDKMFTHAGACSAFGPHDHCVQSQIVISHQSLQFCICNTKYYA